LKKISCFVACAFGKDEVDEIYQNAVLFTQSDVPLSLRGWIIY